VRDHNDDMAAASSTLIRQTLVVTRDSIGSTAYSNKTSPNPDRRAEPIEPVIAPI